MYHDVIGSPKLIDSKDDSIKFQKCIFYFCKNKNRYFYGRVNTAINTKGKGFDNFMRFMYKIS